MRKQDEKALRRGQRYRFFAVILCFMLAMACGGGSSSDSSGNNNTGNNDTSNNSADGTQWTYMVYMGADNNLSSSGLIDLNEMETVGSDDKVNIVLQVEFSTFHTDFDSFAPIFLHRRD